VIEPMLQGIFTPLPTPLTDDGTSISEIRLARLYQAVKDRGFSGWAVNTEVGEFNAFSFSDRKLMVELVMRMSPGMPVLVNVSTPSTLASLDLAQHAERHGAAAVVMAPPYWGPFSDEEIHLHYRTVSQYAHLPLIVVDPRRMISDTMKGVLKDMTEVVVAEPNHWKVEEFGQAAKERPEDFLAGDLCVTPLALFRSVEEIINKEPSLRSLVQFMTRHGTAKVAKAAFLVRGLDLGPLRAPALPLSGKVLDDLKAVLDGGQA